MPHVPLAAVTIRCELEDSVVTAAVAGSLHRWSLSPRTTIRLLSQSENTVFRLDDPGGACLALRVHRPGYNRREEIESELAWIVALRRAGTVDTPAPIAGADGALVQVVSHGGVERHAVAFGFVAGTTPDPGHDLLAWFGELGRITARLHVHARGWAQPPGFTRRCWDMATMFGRAPVWGDWRAAPGLDAAGARVLARAEAVMQQRLERFGRGRDRFGLIHADLRLTNLMVDGGRLRVIDFDDCGFGWFAYDFAAAISFMEDVPAVPDLLRAWTAGYAEVAPLPHDQLAEMPVFVAARRLLLTAWLASHPGAVPLGEEYTLGTIRIAETLLQ